VHAPGACDLSGPLCHARVSRASVGSPSAPEQRPRRAFPDDAAKPAQTNPRTRDCRGSGFDAQAQGTVTLNEAGEWEHAKECEEQALFPLECRRIRLRALTLAARADAVRISVCCLQLSARREGNPSQL
jgi:hypothetical protein